ncbi:MAG: hypothetical protein AB7O24_26425 [Kofleriaceae bacterium]
MTWSCESCEHQQLAEVVFSTGRITEIAAVKLTVEVLERLHYVENTIEDAIEPYLGRSLSDEYGLWPCWEPALRAALGLDRATPVLPATTSLSSARHSTVVAIASSTTFTRALGSLSNRETA